MTKKEINSTEVHNLRSRILNYAILIEKQLEDFIRDYFIDDKNKKTKFDELILGKEFFTFEQKIKVFEKIIKEYGNLKINIWIKEVFNLGEDNKKLLKKIRYIREIRNAVAHTHPFRNSEINEIVIKYNFDRKAKEIILNNSFDVKFFNIYLEVSDILRGLSIELFKN